MTTVYLVLKYDRLSGPKGSGGQWHNDRAYVRREDAEARKAELDARTLRQGDTVLAAVTPLELHN